MNGPYEWKDQELEEAVGWGGGGGGSKGSLKCKTAGNWSLHQTSASKDDPSPTKGMYKDRTEVISCRTRRHAAWSKMSADRTNYLLMSYQHKHNKLATQTQ
jgi:hypothetical protein